MPRTINNSIKRSGLALAGILIVAASLCTLILGHGQALSISSANDCDDNAVMYCGADSTQTIITRYDNGDGHNSAKSIEDIYNYFGISSADVHALNTTAVLGRINSNGNVYIQGMINPVATGAITAGRQNIAGSTPVTSNGTTFYKRAPSVSFNSDALPAFVVMKSGVFQFAIIASCANPVAAAPVPKPAPAPTPAAPTTPSTPTPAPKPTPLTPASSPTPVAPTPAQPTPAAPAMIVARPTRLVDTGPTGLLGVFAALGVIGTLLHRSYTLRKLN